MKMRNLHLLLIWSVVPFFASGQAFASLEKDLDGLIEARKYQEALPVAQQLLLLSKDSLGFKDTTTAHCFSWVGLVYGWLGKFPESALHYDSALLIQAQLLDHCHPRYQLVLRSSITARIQSDRLAEAETLINEAISNFEGPNPVCSNQADYLLMLYNIANVYLGQSKFEQAAALYEKCINNSDPRNRKDSLQVARLYSNYALLHYRLGNLPDAADFLSQTEQMQQALLGNEHPELAATHNALSVMYMKMNDWPKAEIYLDKSLRVIEKEQGKTHPKYFLGLNNLANVYQQKKEFEKAVELYQNVLEFYLTTKGKESSDYIIALGNLAGCLSALKSYNNLEPMLMECVQLSDKVHGHYSLSKALHLKNLMVFFGKTGNYEKAQQYYNECREIYDSIIQPEHPDYVRLRYDMADIHRIYGDYQRSLQLHEEAFPLLKVNIDRNFAGLPDRQRSSFFQQTKLYFEGAANLVERANGQIPGLAGRLYDYCLLTKNALFNSSEKVKQSILSSGDKALKSDYQRWLKLRENIARIYSMPKATAETRILDSLEQENQGLEQSLTRRSAPFSDLTARRVVSWKEVRDALRPGEAAIEIFRYQYSNISFTDTIHYAALIITSDTREHPAFVLLSKGNNLETTYYEAYRSTITDSLYAPPPHAYQHYWEAFEPWLRDIRTIYFAPDGIYHKISLQSLIDRNGTYLLDRFDFRIVGSTKVLLDSPAKPSRLKSSALFGNPNFTFASPNAVEQEPASKGSPVYYLRDPGENSPWVLDPLPNSRDEIWSIKEVLESHSIAVSVFMEEKASEAQLKAVRSPGILHLATHGLFSGAENSALSPLKRAENPEDPYLTSLLFWAGAQQSIDRLAIIRSSEDGILTALEAMSLNLENTEIVVLSACETGLGTILNGEGVYGLQRALQIAGARSVLMSLWKVDDVATKELMVLFYQKWLSGASKHEALRQAQQAMKEKYKLPLYWGAFVLSEK